MKLATRIFNRNRGTGADEYYLTSPFGKRVDPLSGKVSYHNGCDYGTHGNKWAQYALEDGIVENVFVDKYGAKDIWVRYDRLGYRCLHGHLDSFNVSKGQKVNHETILGYTGMSGKAIGIHLHLGVKYINQSDWVDPESIDYEEHTPSEYPFAAMIRKGTNLYTENGTRYKNPASKDRTIEVLGEKGTRYKVYGETFNPHIVYVNKGDVIREQYPFNATIKKGSPLYNESGSKYKNPTSKDRKVIVQGELNGRYRIYGSTFKPNIVYCDKKDIIKD